jgi:hypothetical protein
MHLAGKKKKKKKNDNSKEIVVNGLSNTQRDNLIDFERT